MLRNTPEEEVNKNHIITTKENQTSQQDQAIVDEWIFLLDGEPDNTEHVVTHVKDNVQDEIKKEEKIDIPVDVKNSDFILFETCQENEDEIVVFPPPHFPRRAKDFKCLTFPNKLEEEKAGKKTFHVINQAMRNGKKYYFKHSPFQGSLMPELEVVCAEWFRLLLGDNFVPKASPYYEYVATAKQYHLKGLTSKELPSFIPNHEKPLSMDDLNIVLVETDYDYQKTKLVNSLIAWQKCLDRSSDVNGSYLTTATTVFKNHYNYYMSWWDPNEPTAVWIGNKVKPYVESGFKFSRFNLNDLSGLIEKRKAHVLKFVTNKYQDELECMEDLGKNIDTLLKLKLTDHLDVKWLEDIDHYVKQHEALLPMDQDDYDIQCDILGKSFTCKVKDIKNYRTIRGIAEGLTMSYVNSEGDAHNRNVSKDGKRVDFDMSEWFFTSKIKLKDCSTLDNIVKWFQGRVPTESTFQYTLHDILNFPDLQDAKFYYWPTQQTFISQSTIKTLSSIFNTGNSYSFKDNQVFKQLSTHPVFIFHKYKAMLKYILTNENMYRCIAELNMRQDSMFIDNDGKKKNLSDEFIKYKKDMLDKFRGSLLTVREFRNFIEENGDYVLKMIKDEFLSYKENYQRKIQKGKSYYQKLVDCIDLYEIDHEYHQICYALMKASRFESKKSIPVTKIH